jgi:oligoendopeptidase F
VERGDVSTADKWDVEQMYPSLEDWRRDFEHWRGSVKHPMWPQLEKFRGKFSQGSSMIAQFLKEYFQLDRHLSKLYTYAHLRRDEDVGNDHFKEAYLLINEVVHNFRQETSWVEPELLLLDRGIGLGAGELAPYRFYLEKILRQKPHILSAEQEKLLAGAAGPLQISSRAFTAFNNGDLVFPDIFDSLGKKHSLTHAKYQLYLQNNDRELRKNAFQAVCKTYGCYENTLCEFIYGQVQAHWFNAKARGFSSCLEAALFPFNIDSSVYTNLIKTVRKNLPIFHHYIKLYKGWQKLDELHLYDITAPLFEGVEIKMEYDEAAATVVAAMAPLGKSYCDELRKGLSAHAWVDRYENSRKRSGAYSSGCFDSMPYILMNYQGDLSDISTLAHEAGHSMHSWLTWKTQEYHNASYPIFVAEVASTLNEELLHHYLMSVTEDPLKQAHLLNRKINNIRSTLFRQVMFAEFELKLHQFVESGVPLTPTLLKEEYHKLNRDYFGPDVVIDSAIDIEWARIPHFYYNFYVYQYATGMCAAYALSRKIGCDGSASYLEFLSSGDSRYPLELLKIAGVDMSSSSSIEQTLNHFASLVEELDRLKAKIN